MQNRGRWNFTRIYFLVVCLGLLGYFVSATRSQALSNRMGQTLNKQQQVVYDIGDKITEIEKQMDLAQTAARRDELLMTRLKLESARLDAQLERLTSATTQASFNASQSHYLLFALLCLSFFWTLYYGVLLNH